MLFKSLINSSMCPPWWIDPMTHHTMSKRSYHRATSHSNKRKKWSMINAQKINKQNIKYNGIYNIISISYYIIWEGWKEMFYLMMHFITSGIRQWITHTVRKESCCSITRATLFDNQQGIFYINHLIVRIAHTTAFVKHWLEWEIAK